MKRYDGKKVHAMLMDLTILCGQHAKGGIMTSIVNGPKDTRFWRLVMCKKCRAMHYAQGKRTKP